MRVLVSAVPAIGHIAPLLDLARAIQVAGHDVRFATHPQRHGLVAEADLRPIAAGMSSIEMTNERRRRWPATDRQPATEWATRMWAQIMAPSTLADLRQIIEDWPPHLVVHDEGDYAGPVAAAAAGIPWVTHAWGSPLRPVSELIELEALTSELWASCDLEVPTSAGLYTHALVNPCPRLLQDDSPGATVVWPIRPALLDDGGGDEPLHADAYVGFGTVPTFANAPAELTAAIRSCTTRGLRVVVTAPSAELRGELAAIDRHLVEAREFVSLRAVLPSCKVAITHGGAGTVLAALTAAVPVVVVARGTPSQVRMAQACERAGIGRSCADEMAIDGAVGDVLTERDIAARVADAARQIAAMPPATEVGPLVEALVSAQR